MEPQQTATLLSNNLRVATAKVLGAAHNYSVEPSGENYSRLAEFLAEAEALRMDLSGVIDAIDSMHLKQIAACGRNTSTDERSRGANHECQPH